MNKDNIVDVLKTIEECNIGNNKGNRNTLMAASFIHLYSRSIIFIRTPFNREEINLPQIFGISSEATKLRLAFPIPTS
ncbi:hypothetical protein T09_8001 [Trichinella sp. T9]|nr:hypothetical protein T09_8001 [Trichinella sp. T9]